MTTHIIAYLLAQKNKFETRTKELETEHDMLKATLSEINVYMDKNKNTPYLGRIRRRINGNIVSIQRKIVDNKNNLANISRAHDYMTNLIRPASPTS